MGEKVVKDEKIEQQLHNVSGKIEEIAMLKSKLRDTYSADLSDIMDKKDERYKKKVRCITRSMAEDFSREQVLFSSLIESLFYFVFAIVCVIHVTNLKSSEMFYMNKAVEQSMIEKNFDVANRLKSNEIEFAKISTVKDMWTFIKDVFLDTVYSEEYYASSPTSVTSSGDRGLNVLYENVLLGVPRIRQVRVDKASCVIHPYFQKLFSNCYAAYDFDTESKESFGLKTPTAWVYSDETVTKNTRINGRVGYYGGGGYYLDLSKNFTAATEQINNLMTELWVTRATRAVVIHFSVYNTNLNIFGVCRLLFEIPPTGGVLPDYEFVCVKLLGGQTDWDYILLFCEAIFYIFILFYMIQSLREFIYFKLRYFLRFWTYVDLCISVLGTTTFVMTNYKRANVEAYIEKIKAHPEEFGNIEFISSWQDLHDDISSIILFFVFMRFFKYLNLNRTMGQLNDTLKRCTRDVMGFSVMFFIIFFAYAELGFLLFGTEVNEFRSFGHSMFTLLRTILGDFDYNSIEEAHRYLAPVYFLSYIFLVFFVLLNMFLAIINDTYADVKTELAVTPKEVQVTDYLKTNIGKLFNRFKFFKFQPKIVRKADYNLTAAEIKAALEKCGFNNLEIEMFFARYNINPLSMITEYDVAKIVRELEGMAVGRMREEPTQDRQKNVEELLQLRNQMKTMEETMFGLASKIEELILTLEKLSGDKGGVLKKIPSTDSSVENS